jgi:hypothetical protein
MATSSGVVITNGAERRLTLAAHGFPDGDNVFHPEPLPSWRIGTITDRLPTIDIALCKFATTLPYSNKQYFTVNPPKRLVSTSIVDKNLRRGSWFEAEGFTVGRVHLLYSGPAVGYEGPPYIEHSYLLRSYGFSYFGPEVGVASGGLCGAPVVHEEDEEEDLDGIVLGFIWLLDDRDLIVAAVDDLLETGWQIDSTC